MPDLIAIKYLYKWENKMSKKITEYFIEQSARPSGVVGRLMLRVMNRAYLPMARWAVGLLPGMHPAKILDIGMGNGATSAMLAEHFGGAGQTGGAEVFGVDISPGAVAAAAKRQGDIDFRVADICAGLPFADGEFGLACAFQTHFHWGDIEAGLREACRVLAPGSVLLVAFETVKLEYFAAELREEEAVKALALRAGFASVLITGRQGWTAWLAYR